MALSVALSATLAVAAAASSPIGLTYLREPDVRDVVHGCAEAPLAGPAKTAHAMLRAFGAERVAARVRLVSATADAAREGDERARRVQLELRDPRLLDAAQSEIILLDRLGVSSSPRAELAMAVSSRRDDERSRASARGYAPDSELRNRGPPDAGAPQAGTAHGPNLLGSLKAGAASILVAARADAKHDRRVRPAAARAPSLLAAASPPASPRGQTAPLPPKWYAAYDKVSGRTYYWHEDGRTTWTRPAAALSPNAGKVARKQPASKAAAEPQARSPEFATARVGKGTSQPRVGKTGKQAAVGSLSPATSSAGQAGWSAEGAKDEAEEVGPGFVARMRTRLAELRHIDDKTSKNGNLKKTAAVFALLLVAAGGL
jgi:hypothetical protein